MMIVLRLFVGWVCFPGEMTDWMKSWKIVMDLRVNWKANLTKNWKVNSKKKMTAMKN
jgi:hypothetical protein